MITKQKIITYAFIVLGALTLSASTANAQAGPYEALGDSFSAGPGSGWVPGQILENQAVYETGTIQKCDRSRVAYPTLLATARSLTLRNVSCAGATIDTVMHTGQFGEPAQINAVTADASLITLILGGNDIGFSNIIPCIVTTECTTSSPAIVNASIVMNTLQPKIKNVLDVIRNRAPNAKIALAGYAPEVPDTGKSTIGCIPWLSNSEQTLVNTIERRLNSILQAAAIQAGSNITYIDPFATSSPFMGHDLIGLSFDACSLSAGRMMNGIRADFSDGSFHPDGYGQQSYFKLFSAAI